MEPDTIKMEVEAKIPLLVGHLSKANVLLVRMIKGVVTHPMALRAAAFHDMRRMIGGKEILPLSEDLTLQNRVGHLIESHRIRSSENNPVLRALGIPLHEISTVEELLRVDAQISEPHVLQPYGDCLIEDVENAKEAEDAVIAIRTLAYIEKRGLCRPDWDRVKRRVPDYEAVMEIDLARDSREMSIDERWRDFSNALWKNESEVLKRYVAQRVGATGSPID